MLHRQAMRYGPTNTICTRFIAAYRPTGRARIRAGRIARPIDEASIPPVMVRPARSRALPCAVLIVLMIYFCPTPRTRAARKFNISTPRENAIAK